jgi:MYXO-CTERM domain-containing protein
VTVDQFAFNFNGPDVNPDTRDAACQDSNWFNDLGVGTFYVSPSAECTAGCGAANFASAVITPLFSVVESLISGPLANVLAQALVGKLNGTPVEIQTKLDVRALVAKLLPLRFGNPIGVLAGPHGDGFASDGMGGSAGLKMPLDFGAESDRGFCVPEVKPAMLVQASDPNLPPTITVQDTFTNPPQPRTDIYHAAAAISTAGISRALYAAFNSGLLCIGIGTDDIIALTKGSQVITAGILFLLAPDLERLASAASPVFFELEPKEPPTIALGTGQPTGQLDKNGKPIIDSLVKAGLHGLGLSFYIFIEDRMVRVFGIDADVDLGLNVVRAANNQLKLSIDQLSVTNVKTTFSELVENDFAQVVSSLIDVAMSTLLQNNLTFDLNLDSVVQTAFGGAPIFVRINDVQKAGSNDDFLAVYLTLCDDMETKDIANRICCDQAKTGGLCGTVPIHDEPFALVPSVSPELPLYALPARPLPESLRAELTPTGVVAVHVQAPAAPSTLARPSYRYAVRVDGGALLSPQYANERGDVIVDSPRLMLAGRHHLDILAERPGEPQSLGDVTAGLDLEIDPERPRVWIEQDALGYLVQGEDLVTPKDELLVEARFVDANGKGSWQRVRAGDRLIPAHGDRSLEARATDRVGNVSQLVAQMLPTEPTPTASNRSGCGCRSADQSIDAGGLFAALAITLLWWRRRRASSADLG